MEIFIYYDLLLSIVLPTTFIRHLDTNMVLSIDCVGINVRIVDSNQLLLLLYCWMVWMGIKGAHTSLCEQKWFLRINSKLEHYLRWLDSNKNIPYIPETLSQSSSEREKKRQSKKYTIKMFHFKATSIYKIY